ncbi:hypothetical protein AURDEDRAFT_176311 [Auricularia subglabra TFB-10046 SS5]|nr:hypothetical protein AURDEDRAFT_176311 [Auricularia subglabra TFB-10046 SS5]
MDSVESADYVPPYSVEDSLFFDYGLPDELWCKIWAHLRLESRVVVPRVCRKWRVVSLADPQLWSTLRIASPLSKHHRERFPDSGDEGSDFDPDRDSDDDTPEESDGAGSFEGASSREALSDCEMANLYVSRVPHIPMISLTSTEHISSTLAPTRGAPLTLFIVVYRTVSRRFFSNLSAALRPHSYRIRHLTLFLVRATFVRLLHKLQPLTNLETLEVYSPCDADFADDDGENTQRWDEPSTRSVGRLFWKHENGMPRLQHLRTSALFCGLYGTPRISEPLRCLRSLAVSICYSSCLPVLLLACPLLVTLRIWLEDFDVGDDVVAIDQQLYEAASRLIAVHISGAAQMYKPLLLALFQCPTRLSYILDCGPETIVLLDGNYRGQIPNILIDVHEPTYLHFNFESSRLTVKCGNDLGQTRRLTLPDDDLENVEFAISLARQINPRRLRSIHCPMELRVELLGGAEPGVADDVDMFWSLLEDSDSRDIAVDAHAALTAHYDELSLAWELDPGAEMLKSALVSARIIDQIMDTE